MYKSSIELIRHIERESSFIINSTKKYTFESFYCDEILKRAVVRALEIIGEASKKLSSEFRSNNSQIEWKYIARMRDRLIHDTKERIILLFGKQYKTTFLNFIFK